VAEYHPATSAEDRIAIFNLPPGYFFASADLSQMWVFGLYEFLRTWRERAKKLMDFEDELKKLTTQAERDAYLAKITAEAKESAKHVDQLPVYYPDHVAKIVDSDFMRSVRGDLLQACLRARLRGHRVEASRLAVPRRPRRLLDKGQEPGGARGHTRGP
jgi:hypothetical protein